MELERAVLEALGERADSGGRLLERMQAQGENPFAGRGVLVYGALANLVHRGEVEVISEGPGEVVYGISESRTSAPPLGAHSPHSGQRAPPRPPGFPPSFALGTQQIALIDREIGRLTRGLRPAWFEELRRVVVADADRRVFHGAQVGGAVASALADLGPRNGVRGFLRRVARGRPLPLSLYGAPWRPLLAALILLAALGLLRLFVVGVHTMPRTSSSMAPALIPAVEGGDAIVLSDLVSPRRSAPQRGDIVTFRLRGVPDLLVKRVFGLPGEVVSIREGDLFVGGKRLVKERPLLDRVAVPLGGMASLEEVAQPRGYRLRDGVLHGGYLLPDGSANHEEGEVRDLVIAFRVRARGPGETLTLLIHGGSKEPIALLLDTTGHAGGLSVGGIEGARGPPFALRLGEWRMVWVTNADRCLRIEIDGVEVARETLPREGKRPSVSIVLDGEGISIERFSVARDLFHGVAEGTRPEWRLGPDDLFLLGDNSSHSHDSRHFGPVKRDDIDGRLFAVAWPPSRMRIVQ